MGHVAARDQKRHDQFDKLVWLSVRVMNEEFGHLPVAQPINVINVGGMEKYGLFKQWGERWFVAEHMPVLDGEDGMRFSQSHGRN